MALLPLAALPDHRPEVHGDAGGAGARRRQALAALGPLTRARDGSSLVIFVGMVALWASAATLGLDSTAIAFLGLGVLLATGVLTLDDIAQGRRRPGDVHLVRGAVHAEQPAERAGIHGFRRASAWRGALGGLAAPTAGLVLVVAYVAAALPVRQPDGAPAGALRRVPRRRREARRQPGAPLAFQLLFATNYFSAITPQGSSANLLFAGSGYLSQGELYRLGRHHDGVQLGRSTLVVGTPWLMLVVDR